MKRIIQSFYLAFVLLTVGAIASAFFYRTEQTTPAFHFPYKQAGLTEREAAAHLLSRFSFGAKPGEVDAVTKEGIESWFKSQLDATLPDPKVDSVLAGYESLKMTNEEILK